MHFASPVVRAVGLAALATSSLAIADDANKTGDVEPKVYESLEKTINFFENAQSVTFNAIVMTEDVSSTLQKLQFPGMVEGSIQRPNKIYVKKSGDKDLSLWYDGSTVTILDREANKYSKTAFSGDLSALVEKLDDLGVEAPLGGIFDKGLVQHVKDHVFKGDYYPEETVEGKPSTHLALRQDALDWQMWSCTETGAPKYIVITSKLLGMAPQHSIYFKSIEPSKAALPDDTFQPKLPAGAVEVPLSSDDAESLRDGNW
jgi:hypothetical protein